MTRETILRRRIKLLTLIVIAGLVVSGATAIPLDRRYVRELEARQ